MSWSTSVSYVEMSEGLDEGADEQGGYAIKPYGVAWADRLQFVRDVMGYSSMSGGLLGTWTIRYPLAYPESPELFARSCRVAPNGAFYRTTPITYDQAIVTVTFRPPQWNGTGLNEDPLNLNSFSPDPIENEYLQNCTQEMDWGVEWYDLSNSAATFSPSGDKVNTHLSRRVCVVRMKLTYSNLPYMPFALLQNYVDVVNLDNIFGCEGGTVMLESANTTRRRMTDGTIVQDFVIAFKWRQQDWNRFLKPDGTWELLIFNGDRGQNVFEYINMKPLLQTLAGMGS